MVSHRHPDPIVGIRMPFPVRSVDLIDKFNDFNVLPPCDGAPW